MKIKRKIGPHDFMFRMNFRQNFPRLHKLMTRRDLIMEHIKLQPHKEHLLSMKIYRIDLEIQRQSEVAKKAGFQIEYR